ncbi:PGPGW domain-containing protein [Aestuariimicrobium sp. p3-SID1156]|uniref:PGPGW domain-containing protein n=1 Tax=Aestuariimicrobium sp. p3-SID1156 TaxID=2916038 RepID=UPI00223C3EA2|nr:PGPGW domain-containing protein [Aestuariimicrobium sp. p3-SID1156]MCT1458575.1 PGPGW domain-containing protein [Aestuariimicrobium sp. p3-SID1156]
MTGPRPHERHGVPMKMVLAVLGWTLVVAGIAALALPGPGMLMLLAGLVVLNRVHPWVRHLIQPVRIHALRGAAEGVETWFRISMSALAALGVAAFGGLWLWQPPAPGWWFLREDWWLLGGKPVGATLVASSIIALGLLVYSYRRFHGRPDEVEELEMWARAHKRARHLWKLRRQQERGDRG